MIKIGMLGLLLLLAVMPGFAQWKWFNPLQAEKNVVQGQGWDEALRGTFVRLPQQAKAEVRAAVWGLSQNSAGLAVCFYSNAPANPGALSGHGWTRHAAYARNGCFGSGFVCPGRERRGVVVCREI